MIKLFASDLDGTLLNALHMADSVVRAAVRAVVESGAHFAMATGRTVRGRGDHGFEDLDIEAIGCNGALVVDSDGRVVKHFDIDPAFLEELLRAFPRVCFECVGVDRTLVTGTRDELLAGFRDDGIARRIMMRGMRARRERMADGFQFEQPVSAVLGQDICKLNARVPDPGLERELQAFLAEHADTVVNAPFQPVMFEITDRLVNKGEAVAWLARYLEIGEDEVAVYGDGGNDIAMLGRFARHGHAYATANGCDDARRAAGNVIGPCALHAVPRHIRRTVREQASMPVYTRIE